MFFTMPLNFNKKEIDRMGLKYLYPTDGAKPCSKEPLKVRLDGKHVGEIRKVKDGFQYYPKGQKTGGVVFSNVAEVQNSLVLSQPAKRETEEAVDTDDEIMTQAKKGLKKLEKENKFLNEWRDRSETLLSAVVALFAIQKESKDAINLLEESVLYDGTNCDGHTLLEDIVNHTD